MVALIEAPISLDRENSQRQWVIAGVWTLQELTGDASTYLDGGGTRLRKGDFQACLERTPWGFDWKVELQGSVSVTEVEPQVDQTVEEEGINRLEELLQETKNPQIRRLMAVLREELEARHGQVQEMHVHFRETEAQAARWMLEEPEPWWRHLTRRLLAS